MTFETLQYVDANGQTQEYAFQDLSLDGSTVRAWMEPKSHAPGEFHIVLPQPPEMVISIPFKSQCKVFACRQSAAGAPNSFAGGQILFQGRCWENLGTSSASKVSNEIVLYDALRDLAEITYQIEWNYISGGTSESPVFSIAFFPDVILFQQSPAGQMQPNGTYAPYNPVPIDNTITTWQQIMAIVYFAINYLKTDPVLLQMGTNPEFTPSYCNFFTCRATKCLLALTTCLRPHPLVYTEVDYTTTPPTLHFRYVGNMAPVTLPYKSTDPNGNIHVATDIMALYELVPERVFLAYQVKTTVNGKPALTFVYDNFPINAQPSIPEEVYSINVEGPALQQTTKNFTSYAFSPTDLTLWREKVPSLKSQAEGGQIINDGNPGALTFVDTAPYDPVDHPKGIQVIDHNGNPIDYADTFIYFTNESVYDWFVFEGAAAQAVHATVKTFFSYEKQTTIKTDSNALNLNITIPEHEHSMRVMLTNMPTATYSLSQETTTGEAVPEGLAENIYSELQWLQYKMQQENWQVGKDENTVPQIIKPGKNTINLNGGLAAWQNMNAVPESVKIEFMRVQQLVGGVPKWCLAAKHTISCGPVNHLNPQYRVELLNMFRNRLLPRINPNERLTGEPNGGASGTDLSAEDSKENSVPSEPVPQVQQISGPNPDGTISQVQTASSDLNNGDKVKLTLICALDAAGNPQTGYYAYGPINPPA